MKPIEKQNALDALAGEPFKFAVKDPIGMGLFLGSTIVLGQLGISFLNWGLPIIDWGRWRKTAAVVSAVFAWIYAPYFGGLWGIASCFFEGFGFFSCAWSKVVESFENFGSAVARGQSDQVAGASAVICEAQGNSKVACIRLAGSGRREDQAVYCARRWEKGDFEEGSTRRACDMRFTPEGKHYNVYRDHWARTCAENPDEVGGPRDCASYTWAMRTYGDPAYYGSNTWFDQILYMFGLK